MKRALRGCSSRPVGPRVGAPGGARSRGHGSHGAGVANAAGRPYAGVAMSMAVSAPHLLGRRSECAALDLLVVGVRAGQSRALVLRGEAGVGKSALLEYLAQHLSGCGLALAARSVCATARRRIGSSSAWRF